MTARRLGDLAILASQAAVVAAALAMLWFAFAPAPAVVHGPTTHATTHVCGGAPCP